MQNTVKLSIKALGKKVLKYVLLVGRFLRSLKKLSFFFGIQIFAGFLFPLKTLYESLQRFFHILFQRSCLKQSSNCSRNFLPAYFLSNSFRIVCRNFSKQLSKKSFKDYFFLQIHPEVTLSNPLSMYPGSSTAISLVRQNAKRFLCLFFFIKIFLQKPFEFL